MPKSREPDDEKPKKLSTYTAKLTDEQMDLLGQILKAKGWQPFEVAYARYAFKGTDCNVTAYESRKLVVAGKGTEEFVTMILEPDVTKVAKLGYDEVLHPEWFESHAGLDESGKGDFFGPVVAATVIADKAAIDLWREAGVQDSKKITENRIFELEKVIRNTPGVAIQAFKLGMPKYNELMAKPRANLNLLLAWEHAIALTEALNTKRVPWGLLDQFSEQPLVQRELKKRGVENFELKMRTKAEEDPVVAAASIVARAEFVREMVALSRKCGIKLQKGAGPLVKEQAHEIIRKFGARSLGDYAKLHFRTAYEVVKAAGKLDELPLPEPKERFERD
jgi:ribonuclease HIII